MAYLDIAGLQYFWEKIKTKFAEVVHTHDDRYYTEDEMNVMLLKKSDTSHVHDDKYLKLSGGTVTGNLQVDGTTTLKGTVTITNDCSVDEDHNFIGDLAGNADTATNADYATNAGSAKTAITATQATMLSGFSTATTSQGWGNQTGTFIHGENDATGGSLAFRRDNPVAGEVSMIIDGRFYQNEGKYMCLDTQNYSSYALPLTGGQMRGAIKFADIGNTATSNKITWNGSTDGADIYYQTTASDQGNLVLNLRDDNNCYLRIAQNGTFRSYFSPSDGNFHGNVNGNATTATTAAKLGRSGNTAYPMTFNWSGQSGQPTWLWGGNDGSSMYVYNPSNFSVNYAKTAGSASSATTATTAAKLGRSGNTAYPMTFNWSGQSGQPTWLWGGNDGSSMYVYNPSNFSVNYAKTAGSASSATTATNGLSTIASGYVRIGKLQICYGKTSSDTSVSFATPFTSVYSACVASYTSKAGWAGCCFYSLSTTGLHTGVIDNSPTVYYIAIGYYG